MKRVRVIPVLLLRNAGLVKTIRFRDPFYVGDPINAVKIFNDKEVDELVFLDITAPREKRGPNLRLIRELAGECFMPLCYGGGIRTMEEIRSVFTLGVEKVCLNSAVADSPGIITQAVKEFGSSSIVVSVDVKKNLFGSWQVHTHGGTVNTKQDPVAWARRAESLGAGEILLQSIDRDGTYSGYDLKLLEAVSHAVKIPVIAGGGASAVGDFLSAVQAGASAVSAGSLFVFHGRNRAVLINFPSAQELREGLWTKV